ncbi:MAG: protein kinase [bacterium]
MTTQDSSGEDQTRSFVTLTEGTKVGHYRIISKIGAGGMGEVYLAEDTKLNRNVALKFLPPHLCQDEDCRRRFKREAQAAAKLDHPNIAPVYEVGDFKGRPFFAMAHIEGHSLRDTIKQGKLTVSEAIGLTMQICEGLHKAHDSGVVHRDIKPSNIVIDSEGRARILDFGLATVSGEEKLTKTGSTLGTIGYMSPEQVEGKQVDLRSDIFSVGVILYEMLTGRRPFEGDTETAVARSITDATPEPVARYKSGETGELQQILNKALSKDSSLRYQHADGMLADLKRLTLISTPVKKGWLNLWVVWIVLATLVLVLIVWQPWISDTASDKPEKIMLAILPFENLGDPKDEYFADGMTDEITSRLAMVHNLGVISRTSAYAYKSSDKTLPVIAKELGVDYVLEGTIRWDKSGDTDRVRITPQLIQVADDIHLWAGNFQIAMTEIFDVQIHIATRIVDTLGVTLLASERQSMGYKPTDDIDAYDLYLQAKEYDDSNEHELAIALLEKAVEADPDFAKAHSRLARIHGFLYFNWIDRSEQRLNLCEQAANNAARTSREGVEGHIGLGYFSYYCQEDYDRALDEFNQVLEQQPNNSEVLAAIGYVQRRQGKWQEAADNLKKAVEIDPHSQGLAMGLATTLSAMGESKELIRALDKSLSLRPDAASLLFFKAAAVLQLSGDTTRAREILDLATQYGEPEMVGFWMEGFDVLFRDYESAINRREVPGSFILADSGDFYLIKAEAYRFWARDSLSQVYYDSARVVAEQRSKVQPHSAFNTMTLGSAYAGLGRVSDAIREGRKAVDLLPVSQDALYGPGLIEELASIYVLAGEHDLAIDQLEVLMSIPSGIAIYDLRHHPEYDPLRDHPRFQALLEKYENSEDSD